MDDETSLNAAALETELGHRPTDAKVLLLIGTAMVLGAIALAFFFNGLRNEIIEQGMRINEQFKSVNDRFDKVDRRFDSVDGRLHALETNTQVLTSKLDGLQQDVGAIKSSAARRVE